MSTSWLLVLLLALLLLLALVAWAWERGRASRASRARVRVAAEGEEAAEALLEAAGFTVVDRQVWAEWTMVVDGIATAVACRADLLVTRAGETFVAEVKTGERAPDPCLPATRRQLLEYALAFEVDGVLLVDMTSARVRSVRLPLEPG